MPFSHIYNIQIYILLLVFKPKYTFIAYRSNTQNKLSLSRANRKQKRGPFLTNQTKNSISSFIFFSFVKSYCKGKLIPTVKIFSFQLFFFFFINFSSVFPMRLRFHSVTFSLGFNFFFYFSHFIIVLTTNTSSFARVDHPFFNLLILSLRSNRLFCLSLFFCFF